MNFTPETSKAMDVPYYDDVRAEDGWQGQRTAKSADVLKAEIATAIGRLGGLVSAFQQGTFVIDGKSRQGFQIHYAIQSMNGQYVPGRIDVAALPVRANSARLRDASMQMALYMVREAIDGMWFLQQLSPGYAPLMPWMLADGKRTVSQMWADSAIMNNLLPPSDSDFIEAKALKITKKAG